MTPELFMWTRFDEADFLSKASVESDLPSLGNPNPLNRHHDLRALSKRYGFNLKTVANWRKRTSVADLATGPK